MTSLKAVWSHTPLVSMRSTHLSMKSWAEGRATIMPMLSEEWIASHVSRVSSGTVLRR
jgi:hypothetical protein